MNDSSPVIGPDGSVYVRSADRYLYAFTPNGNNTRYFLSITRLKGTIFSNRIYEVALSRY